MGLAEGAGAGGGRLSAGGGGSTAGGAGSTGGAGGGLCSTWAAISSFVILPPRPLPLIEPTSAAPSPAAAAALRAAGITGAGAPAGGGGDGLRCDWGSGHDICFLAADWPLPVSPGDEG